MKIVDRIAGLPCGRILAAHQQAHASSRTRARAERPITPRQVPHRRDRSVEAGLWPPRGGCEPRTSGPDAGTFALGHGGWRGTGWRCPFRSEAGLIRPEEAERPPAGSLATYQAPREDHPWSVYIVDHPERSDSPWFTAAKTTALKILGSLGPAGFPYGPGPWEMHHAGSLWVCGSDGWRMYRARAGIEWSMQFCADPAKVDRLRQDALTLVRAFPATLPGLTEIGYDQAEEILTTPVTDAAGVARYTDSLYNSCVPLTRPDHQGILPEGAGEHHYPWPAKAGDFIRYDDFQLWVTMSDGSHGAVTPVAPRGSGNGRVQLVYARHGTPEGHAVASAQQQGKAVILPPGHALARQAYIRQS